MKIVNKKKFLKSISLDNADVYNGQKILIPTF